MRNITEARKQARAKVSILYQLLKHSTGCLGNRASFVGVGACVTLRALGLERSYTQFSAQLPTALKLLIIFAQGGLHFHFALVPQVL